MSQGHAQNLLSKLAGALKLPQDKNRGSSSICTSTRTFHSVTQKTPGGSLRSSRGRAAAAQLKPNSPPPPIPIPPFLSSHN